MRERAALGTQLHNTLPPKQGQGEKLTAPEPRVSLAVDKQPSPVPASVSLPRPGKDRQSWTRSNIPQQQAAHNRPKSQEQVPG